MTVNKNLMLSLLEGRMDAYRQHRPATAEMDITIVRAYCSGRSAKQIAMNIPCSETTVYRAIRRVQEFLDHPEGSCWLDVLNRQIQEQEINYGDWNAQSLLEMLYVAYTDYNQIDTGCGKTGFVTLEHLLSCIPKQTFDTVFDTVCDLCACHERAGFTEGLKLGIRLRNELTT